MAYLPLARYKSITSRQDKKCIKVTQYKYEEQNKSNSNIRLYNMCNKQKYNIELNKVR